jgi:hypothetical protein
MRFSWTDAHSGESYRIRTKDPSDRAAIRVQSFADILDRFRIHPEAKSAGPDGKPSHSRTNGLLGRLHVRTFTVSHIGKESNLLEQQEEGMLIADPQAVYWGKGDVEAVRSHLRDVSIPDLATLSRVSERMLQSVRQGTRQPSAKTFGAVMAALAQMLDEGDG